MNEPYLKQANSESRQVSTGARYFGAALSLLKSRQSHRPFFLAHAVTYACNSKCKTCTYWQMTNRKIEDMSTKQVFKLLDDAYNCGMRGYYLFGGEPTVRSDIGTIIDYAKTKGFLTTMNTNGSLLTVKAKELCSIDMMFVSLDYFNSYHDFIRGKPGAFKEVMDGIEEIRKGGNTRVVLVTTISSLNFEAIEPMAKLARDLHVGISYNSVEPTVKSSFEDGRSESPVTDYGLTKKQLQTFYEKLLKLKKEGYPLMETELVLKHFVEKRSWKCDFPKMFVYVSADNKIFSCTYDHTYDLNQGSFKDYFSSKLYQEHVTRAQKCNMCIRTCVRGYVYTYNLNPIHALNLLVDAKILLQNR
ncbi:MAG: radical SAM protein [Candidatus Bathyarchaeia archaeon]